LCCSQTALNFAAPTALKESLTHGGGLLRRCAHNPLVVRIYHANMTESCDTTAYSMGTTDSEGDQKTPTEIPNWK
jgi:hypothetical protein